MRKKCVSCGLICFLTDDTCKRCESDQLEMVSIADRATDDDYSGPAKQASSPRYLKYFCYAVAFECVALLLSFWGFAGMGMRHTANAPTSIIESLLALLVLALHFPTLFLNLALMMLTGSEVFLFITPITQIAFWTYFLARLNHRRRFRPV